MDQTLINWLLGGFGALIGFLLNAVWQAVKDLQSADRVLTEKVGSIEVLVAGAYLKRQEFNDIFHDTIKALFLKLDKIEDKLNGKVDK